MIPHHTQLRSSLASRECLLPIPKYSLLMAPVPVDIFLWSGLLPGLFSPWTSVLCHLPFQWKWWTLAFSMPVTKQPPSHPPATETPSGLLWASVLTEVTILVSLKSVGHSPRSCCCWLNALERLPSNHTKVCDPLCRVFLLGSQWQFLEIVLCQMEAELHLNWFVYHYLSVGYCHPPYLTCSRVSGVTCNKFYSHV